MSTGDRQPCAGCGAEDAGLDRLAYRHEEHCPKFDAFYDAGDDELAEMVPPGPVGSTPVSEEPARPPTDEHDRYLIGCSLIQSGYIDQDDDAPGWFDLVQWHHCFVEPNCQGPTCFGCSGVPFISDEVWREMRKAVDKIREEAYARGISEGRRQATEGWEREWSVRYNDRYVLGLKFTEGGATRRAEDEDGKAASRLVGPWEPAEQDAPSPVKHARGCACGINDAGQRVTDLICRGQ